MYVTPNFKTKKELKEAVAAGNRQISFFQPGVGAPPPENGVIDVEGPQAPLPHSWYAQVTLKNGKPIKVK